MDGVTGKKEEWRAKHAGFWLEHHIENLVTWTEGKELFGLVTESTRVKDLLDLVSASVQQANPDISTETLESEMYIDICQRIMRKAWTDRGRLFSMNTSSSIFSYKQLRPLECQRGKGRHLLPRPPLTLASCLGILELCLTPQQELLRVFTSFIHPEASCPDDVQSTLSFQT